MFYTESLLSMVYLKKLSIVSLKANTPIPIILSQEWKILHGAKYVWIVLLFLGKSNFCMSFHCLKFNFVPTNKKKLVEIGEYIKFSN